MGRRKRPEHVEVRIVRMHGKKVKDKRTIEIINDNAATLVDEIEAALKDLNA
jgi:hypothetical protein